MARGGVVAHATETCYGLACDLRDPAAVRKVFAIKRRAETQPVSALFASVDEAKRYVVWNARAEELARERLPGPLTLVLPLRDDAPVRIFPTPSPIPRPLPPEGVGEGKRGSPSPSGEGSGVGGTVGVRVSPHTVASALAEGFGAPLSTTSANVHGQPNPYSAEDILAQFAEGPAPDLVLDSGTLPQTPPSTVMDLTTEGGGRILREHRDSIVTRHPGSVW